MAVILFNRNLYDPQTHLRLADRQGRAIFGNPEGPYFFAADGDLLGPYQSIYELDRAVRFYDTLSP